MHGERERPGAGAPGPGHPLDDVHFREYKIILRPDRFTGPDGFVAVGKLLRGAARDVDVAFTGNGRDLEHHVREVLFYDTARFDLYNHSFILRTRRVFRDGWPQPEHELTFKVRHPDVDVAARAHVTPRLPCDYEIKFKEELLPLRARLGGIRSLYSHNSVLDSPKMTLAALGHIARVFPVLREIEARPTTRLDLVNRTAVEEVYAELGELHFGHGLKGKVTLALWRNRGTQEPLVAEFGYQCKFERYNELHHKPKRRSEDLFKTMQHVARGWAWLGTTKTAIVYGLGKRAPKHRE